MKSIKLGGQGLLLLMKSKFLIIMTRPQTFFSLRMFCSFVIIIKNFNFINSSRRPWLPNLISHLFHPGLFSSWPLLSYTRDVLVEISLLFLVAFPLNDHDLIDLIILLVYCMLDFQIIQACLASTHLVFLNIAFVQVAGMHVCVYVCTCMCAYMCVCMCACVYVCICVSLSQTLYF